MIITKLELKDFGRHKHLVCGGMGAVVGLLGPNGFGKSTILQAIAFAFTGQLDGNQESYVRNYGADDGANNAQVHLEFQKNGQAGKIFRQIGKTAKRSLEWRGETLTKAKEVDTALEDILGADKLALTNAIFISQGELDRLLFGTPGERQELFTRMLLLSYVGKRGDILDGRIKTLSSGVQDFSMMKDELKVSRDEAEDEVHSLENALRETRNWHAEQQLFRQFCDSAERRANLSRELTALKSEKLQLDSQFVQAREGLPCSPDSLDSFVASLETEVDKLNQELNLTTTLLARWKEHTRTVRELDEATQEALEAQRKFDDVRVTPEELQERIKRLETERENIHTRIRIVREVEELRIQVEKAKVSWQEAKDRPMHSEETLRAKEEEIEEKRREYAEVHAEVKSLQKLRDVLEGHADSTCPVCGGPITETLRKNLETLPSLEARFKPLVSEGTLAKQELQRMKDENMENQVTTDFERGRYMEYLQKLTEKQKTLQETPEGTQDLQKIEKALEEARNQNATVAALQATLRACRQRENLAKQQALSCPKPEQPEPDLSSEAILRETLKDKQALLTNTRTRAREFKEAQQAYARNRSIFESKEQALTTETTELNRTIEVIGRSKDLSRVIRELGCDLETGGEPMLSDQREEVNRKLRENQREFDEAQGRVEQAKKHLIDIRERQRVLEERMEADAVKRQVIDELRQLRQALPAVTSAYLRYRFEQLVELTQEQLADMDANFTVESDPDNLITFRFSRLDEGSGYTMDQSKLSGGQKVRLTVAFLLAVQQLVIPEVGFLVLDEPSVHLDEQGVESLRELLMQLQQKLGNTESQVIVCDHDPRLNTAFSSVIQLTK